MYPIRSPNGSTIIIYGHEQGLRVLWRGGRSFKPSPAPQATPKANGASGISSADAMVIDDSDDDIPQKEPEPEFEEEDEESDLEQPYHRILRHVHIQLGARVLQVAIPHVPWNILKASPGTYPPLFSTHIVLAVACADCSTRIVTLPLIPPAPTVVGSSKLAHTVLNLGTQHDLPSNVSITHTASTSCSTTASTSRSRSQGPQSKPSATTTRSFGATKDWSLLIATHHSGPSDLLLIHQIPILEDSTTSPPSCTLDKKNAPTPMQRRYLQSPASKISFNPSPYPAERHSQLLVSQPSGAVKVYSCFPSSSSRTTRGRQDSDADEESTKLEGRWLITLYPGFRQDSNGSVRRKQVVDAEWVLGGRAIIALFADAEWGVWDIEGAGPGAMNLVRGQGSVQGVSGSALTTLALRGLITLPEQGGSLQQPAIREGHPSKLMPTTPHTKRVRQETMFRNAPAPTPAVTSVETIHGGISVLERPAQNQNTSDESLILWHGSQNLSIPSLQSFWRSKTKEKGNASSDPSHHVKPSQIEGLSLFGERQTGISQLPLRPSVGVSLNVDAPEILVAAEHRIILLVRPPKKEVATQTMQQTTDSTIVTDQVMLTKGELDVDGMDRILNDMAAAGSPIPRSRHSRSPVKRRPRFA